MALGSRLVTIFLNFDRMDISEKQYEILVLGRVQGVGFRYAAQNQARALLLKGWVENRADGSVYIVIRGQAASCMQFISWCRKGPGYSWVEKIELKEAELSPLTHFRIRR